MAEVSRCAMLPYAPQRMYAIVDDIDAYPSFLPWCRAAYVHRRNDREVQASLEIHAGGVTRRVTTRNRLYAGERIEMHLVDGPFRRLEGRWSFEDDGAGTHMCLELDFEFANPVMGLLFTHSVREHVRSLVDAVAERALVVYGKR